MDRITFNPNVLSGNASIRNMSVSADMIWSLVQLGHSSEDILRAYPYLELEDILEVITHGELGQLEEAPIVAISKRVRR